MNPISRSIHDRRVFPAALIVAIAALAIFGNHSFAQSKSVAESEAIPHLPYGVTPQESRPGSPPRSTEPLGVTVAPAVPGEPRRAPLPRRKPPAKVNPETMFTGVPAPALVPGSASASVPAPAPAPPNPLWDLPDAPRIGVESADALERKFHLPADKHGIAQSGAIGWLSVLGLLSLGAVAIALGQRGKRGEGQKRRRRSQRAAY